MIRKSLRLLSKQLPIILSAALISPLAAATDKSNFKSMDVFELEWASSPQISPNGKQIVYRRNYMDMMTDSRKGQLWLVNDKGQQHIKLTSRDVSESSAVWSPSGDRIAFTSRGNHGSEIFVYWVHNGHMARITQLERSPSRLSWSPDGKQIAFSSFVPSKPAVIAKLPKKPKGAKWAKPARVTTRLKYEQDGSGYLSPGFSHLFVVPADGGTARQVTSGDFHHRSGAQWSTDGSKLIFSANRHANWEHEFRNSEIYSVSVKTGKIDALTDRNGPDYGVVISPNGKQLAYLGYDDKKQAHQQPKLYLMDLNGSNKKQLKTGLDRIINGLQWTESGLYFRYDNHGNTKVAKVSLKGKVTKLADNLGGTSIGRPYAGGSFSVNDSGNLAYTYGTPYAPADVAVINGKGKKASKPRLVTDLNSDLLDYRQLGKVEELWYKSSFDQRDLQGWLVYPPNYQPGNKYPLIVENHGGPILNYGDRFSPEMQLFAAAGYIVFYPNPRGSTSYGEEFANLLHNNYPGEDYLDVMDGVDAVLAKGLTSEDQLYVTGGSAGGIMSAWMIGKNHRFEAAAVIKPVMNWISKTLVADNYYAYANYRYPGQPWENFEGYWKFSPVSLVGNIQTPTLVMVGTEDMRTPLSESKQLYNALKLRDIDTALVEMPGAPHFIGRKPSQLISKIAHILAWFDKYPAK